MFHKIDFCDVSRIFWESPVLSLLNRRLGREGKKLRFILDDMAENGAWRMCTGGDMLERSAKVMIRYK